MHPSRTRSALVLAIGLCVAGAPSRAAAEGEPDGTFPTWEERWVHELVNRARCDPQADLATCTSCPDAPCYSPVAPLRWSGSLNRAARFHSTNLTDSGCSIRHESPCVLVADIDDIYPNTCDGAVTCACEGGTFDCGSGENTVSSERIALFGAVPRAENIGFNFDPTWVFYSWLLESSTSEACTWDISNGHRYNILADTSGKKAVGVGFDGDWATLDFGVGTDPDRIPSGSHYPRQAETIEAWANWYDASGPAAAAVNVDGVCHPMSLGRGSAINGAWMAEVTDVGSGCHRYYFEFQDSLGSAVTYPTTGSLAIGSGTDCPDWSATRPDPCLVASAPIFTDGFENGNTSLWSATVPQ